MTTENASPCTVITASVELAKNHEPCDISDWVEKVIEKLIGGVVRSKGRCIDGNEVRKLSWLSRRVIKRSLIAMGMMFCFPTSFFLHGKANPVDILFACLHPFPKDRIGGSDFSSTSLVSLKAATSMSKRTSSRHTSTVLLSRRSMSLMPNDVRTFHAPTVKGLKATGALSVWDLKFWLQEWVTC